MNGLMNFNNIVDKAYEIYRNKMMPYFGYTTLMTVISTMIMNIVLVVIAFVVVLFSALVIAGVGFSGGTLSVVILGAIVIIGSVWLSIASIVSVGPIHGAIQEKRGGHYNFSDMFSFSFKHFFPVFTSSLVYYFLLGLIILAGIFIYSVIINVFSWNIVDNSLAVILLFIIDSVLTIIACLWFMTKAFFYLPIAVCEHKFFIKAIIASFKMVNGQFKRILGLILGSWLSYVVVYLSITYLYSAVSGLVLLILRKLTGATWEDLIAITQIFYSSTQVILAGLVAPVRLLVQPVAYLNEVERLHAVDLYERLERLKFEQQQLQNAQQPLAGEAVST